MRPRQRRGPIPTVSIDVLVALVPKLVHVRVFLVVVFDGAAVVAGVPKVVLVHVPLVHVWHQHAVVLRGNRISVQQEIPKVSTGRGNCTNLHVGDPVSIRIVVTGISNSITVGIFLPRIWYREAIILSWPDSDRLLAKIFFCQTHTRIFDPPLNERQKGDSPCCSSSQGSSTSRQGIRQCQCRAHTGSRCRPIPLRTGRRLCRQITFKKKTRFVAMVGSKQTKTTYIHPTLDRAVSVDDAFGVGVAGVG